MPDYFEHIDIIIVGSGPAAIASALALQHKKVGLLDIGVTAPKIEVPNENFYDVKKQPQDFPNKLLIGEQFESLSPLFQETISPKLKAPLLRFVTESLTQEPSSQPHFKIAQSNAKGGLANAWGSGLYPFTAHELKEFPFAFQELSFYYDKLTEEIGISGIKDDLTPFFGPTDRLLPPIKISRQARFLLEKYEKHKSFLNTHGLYLGTPRLGVLTKPKQPRPSYNYSGLECFHASNPAIYNPTYTLDRLLQEKKIQYFAKKAVISYEEQKDKVLVHAINLISNEQEVFSCRQLILAAGAINTAKIVLKSNENHGQKLPILDNAISQLPFMNPRFIGYPQEKSFFSGAQLNIILDDQKYSSPLIGSFYEPIGLLRSDFVLRFPFSVKTNILLGKYLTPALSSLQIFYPDKPSPHNTLGLNKDNQIIISQNYYREEFHEEEKILKLFRKLGFFSMKTICKKPRPGSSIHYAGCLPMKKDPKAYETFPNGRLFGTKNIYISDAATFPTLPAKNLTFTIMANAMRIADRIAHSD